MNADTFNHSERAAFLERLTRLAGSTTWREPGASGGGYGEKRVPTEHLMAFALGMARRNPLDVGPDVAYSVATGTPYRRSVVTAWLATKLIAGTGQAGKRNEVRMDRIANEAYALVIGETRSVRIPKSAGKHARDFELLVNIGAGWLWIAMEIALERAEYAMDAPAGEGLAVKGVIG